jgi:hypothetical protein
MSEIKRVDWWCVIYAFANARAWSVKKGKKVRIAVFEIEPGVNHYQAQYEDEYGWHYLTDVHTPKGSYTIPYGKNHQKTLDKEPIKYMTLTEAENEQRFLLSE